MAAENSLRRRWTEEETILALYLYFQLPFGKLHSGNPEIRQLAEALDRRSSSIAMKLCNFASLDPKITESGRKGWPEPQNRTENFTPNSGTIGQRLSLVRRPLGIACHHSAEQASHTTPKERVKVFFRALSRASTTQALVNQRVGQDFSAAPCWPTMRIAAASLALPNRVCW
jgi:hypothetical protein